MTFNGYSPFLELRYFLFKNLADARVHIDMVSKIRINNKVCQLSNVVTEL